MLKKLQERYNDSKDVFFKEYKKKFTIIYQEGLGNINLFNRDYLPLMDNVKDLELSFPGVIIKAKKHNEDYYDELLFSGDILIVYNNELYSFKINNTPDRGVSDSKAEPDNLLGARDGFIENIKVNTALIRTRIKNNDLQIEEFYVGKRTKTIVKLFSMKGIANPSIKKKVAKYIKSLDVDLVLSTLDISQKLCQKSIVSSVLYTGSPDLASISLLNGQMIIMIDRIPVVLIAPSSLFFFTKERNDFEIPLFHTIFLRIFILLGLFFSIFGLGIFHSFLTYQSGNLSEVLINVLKKTEEGVLFGSFAEIIMTLSLFEFYQLISTRSPGLTVQTIIIVLGGFLIGQNAIDAKIVGGFVLSFTALCYLSGYIVSNNATILISISLMRVFILFSSLIYGLYGVILGSILLISYLYHQTSFGLCFTHPFAPFVPTDIKKFFIARSSTLFKERPQGLHTLDKKIKGENNEKN